MKSDLARFEEKFIPEPMSGCWIWLGAFTRGGYGHFSMRGKPEKAHRVAFTLYKDKIPINFHVLHKCDNPACVNPAHLMVGSASENMRQMHARGRHPRPNPLKPIAPKGTHTQAKTYQSYVKTVAGLDVAEHAKN